MVNTALKIIGLFVNVYYIYNNVTLAFHT